MSEPHEHLEHAEHDSHHAHDPFDRRVAVSMAIIAAILAGISTAGHRKHNEVLQLQGESNRMRTEAAAFEVIKSNNFAWYQAKRNRQALYETSAALAEAAPAGGEGRKPAPVEKWRKAAAEYNDELKQIKADGDAAGKKAEELSRTATRLRGEVEHAHHQADRLDLAHLLAEVGLVVCSVSILTKRKAFWVAGVVAAALALGVAGSAYLISDHADHPATHEESDGHAAPDAGQKPPKGGDGGKSNPAPDKSNH